MLRLSLGRAAGVCRQIRPPNPQTAAARLYAANAPEAPNHKRVAGQMIQYALGHARSQKSGESYAQALMVLEQGLSNLGGGGGGDSAEDAMGMLMLAMSTLLYERGEIQDAVEKLQMVRQFDNASLALKAAAWEALVGLKLETGQDVSSSVLEDEFHKLLSNSLESNASSYVLPKLRAKAVKGLGQLVLGDLTSAESSFDGCQACNLENKDQMGIRNVVLSHGEFLHVVGNFSPAKDLYDRVVHVFETKDVADNSYLASANMVSEEVLLGATCALGQLLSHSGKFNDAEDLLTKALTKAEEQFGSNHPKVGIVLTCIAMMFKHKAKLEASSSILIQEGLYRRAIDLLKAPSIGDKVADMQVDRRDIVALARGGYAEILCLQQNRKGEGERMKNWAEATWRNRRLSLAEALEFSEPSKAAVIDTRICRVL